MGEKFVICRAIFVLGLGEFFAIFRDCNLILAAFHGLGCGFCVILREGYGAVGVSDDFG